MNRETLYNQITKEDAEQIREWYRFLHRRPELSTKEFETTSFIKSALTKLNIETLDLELPTGAVGILRGGKPGPTILLRADIDALPVREDEAHALRSENEGVMHACGHDAHTAGLLGAASLLRKRDLAGTVLFLFQPAEEIVLGAKQVIEAGLFERFSVDASFALHMWPEVKAGSVGVKKGVVMAAKDSFVIRVTGRGGHGSAPHMAADPIVAGAAIVTAAQTIVSRNVNPRESAVLSICSVHSEGADNIIPGSLEMRGSIRSCSPEARGLIMERLGSVVRDVAAGYSCAGEVEFYGGVPETGNSDALYETAVKCVTELWGREAVVAPETSMVSEDYSEYARFAPTFMYLLGTGKDNSPPLHNPAFQLDEDAPVRGAVLLAGSCWKLENRK